MKEAIIHPGIKVDLINKNPIPEPGPNDVIIKVVVAATNPIDWKSITTEEELKLHGDLGMKSYSNAGKDVSGTVHTVGQYYGRHKNVLF